MDQITPVLDRASANFETDLTTDDTDAFSYVRNCWQEAMRLQPPTPFSTQSCFSKDITINGIRFTPTTGFMINFYAIHRDPKEWIDPERYEPDRFN